jgi:type II secretory pathway pseudopilin PulG
MVKYVVIAAVVAALGGPAMAASKKETDCAHQAAVVAAVQQARIDRVGERKVPAHVAANATWPDRYNTAIPLVTPWVYEMKMRDVRAQDLSSAWQEMCLAQ